METKSLYDNYILTTYPPAPITFIKGEGSWIWDDKFNKYLDFATGIAVNNIGHCHPTWVEQVSKQATKLVHISNLYASPLQGQLAKKIVSYAGPGKCFFCNSGSEANEAQIKLARLFGAKKAGQEGKCYKIITAQNAFHGRTLGSLAATPQEKIQKGFSPLLDGFAYAEFNNLESFEKLIDEETAAILIEPIQGESGVLPADKEFLQGLRKLCDKHNLLLMFDEVQTGAGRTGTYFAFEQYDVKPDSLSMAKGIGGGFPMAGIWVTEKHAGLFTPGSHATTFGGTPIACAAALATIEVIETEDLFRKVQKQSKDFFKLLNEVAEKFPEHIECVRGLGYHVAVIMKKSPLELITKLRSNGLLTVPAGNNAVRFLPPLTASIEELESAVSIFQETLSQITT